MIVTVPTATRQIAKCDVARSNKQITSETTKENQKKKIKHSNKDVRQTNILLSVTSSFLFLLGVQVAVVKLNDTLLCHIINTVRGDDKKTQKKRKRNERRDGRTGESRTGRELTREITLFAKCVLPAIAFSVTALPSMNLHVKGARCECAHACGVGGLGLSKLKL